MTERMNKAKEIAEIIMENTNLQVEIKVNNKTNITRIGLLLIDNKEIANPCFYIDCYPINEYSANEIAKMIVSDFINLISSGNIPSISAGNIKEKLKTCKIMLKLINREMNKELLEEAIHMNFLDLAFTYRAVVDENATILITNDNVSLLGGINNDRLVNNETYIFGLNDLFDCSNNEFKKVNIKEWKPKHIQPYVLTNSTGYFGASVIANNKDLKKIADEFEDDLWILPSSVHELIVSPASIITKEEAIMMIEGGNSTMDIEDILSNRPYFFSRKEGKFID